VDAQGNPIPPANIVGLLITRSSNREAPEGVLVNFIRSPSWMLTEAGRNRNIDQGMMYFDLNYAEYIVACSFTQDTKRLLSIQFLTNMYAPWSRFPA
jgi:hypothetical protein